MEHYGWVKSIMDENPRTKEEIDADLKRIALKGTDTEQCNVSEEDQRRWWGVLTKIIAILTAWNKGRKEDG